MMMMMKKEDEEENKNNNKKKKKKKKKKRMMWRRCLSKKESNGVVSRWATQQAGRQAHTSGLLGQPGADRPAECCMEKSATKW